MHSSVLGKETVAVVSQVLVSLFEPNRACRRKKVDQRKTQFDRTDIRTVVRSGRRTGRHRYSKSIRDDD
jgi:hypothetical protein